MERTAKKTPRSPANMLRMLQKRRAAQAKRRRATPEAQTGVKLRRNSRYRTEEPRCLLPKWRRDAGGRLVSNLPRRANIGDLGTLEVFYHVWRESPDEILPPPKTLWRQRYGDDQTISYRPLWIGAAGNLTPPLRRRSTDSVLSVQADLNGAVGSPYLYEYDEEVLPDEEGLQYRRWRPLKILVNGGYGVVITYVDEGRRFTEDSEIPDEDIVKTVVDDITESERLRQTQSPGYNHHETPSEGFDIDTTDTFSQETEILEILDMTGSPHFPRFWKLADPPQDGTLCAMEYIPGGRTLKEHLDLRAGGRTHIRVIWEAVFCLSKAMSVMAY